MKLRLGIITCAVSFGVVRPAVLPAQEPADSVLQPPIVVTATMVPLPADRVPARVTVFTGEELEARGVRYLREALQAVAGAHVTEAGSFGSVSSVFLRGGESDYVQVLIDGVPVNSPGGSFDFANLTVDNVERIEVVSGPASVLYGSDAISGVIQVFTRNGGESPEGSVSLSGGTYSTVDTRARFSAGSRRATYSVSVSHLQSDGIYTEDAAGARFDNGYRNTVASGRFKIEPDDRTGAALTFRYSDSKYNFPTDGAGNLVDLNSFTESEVTTLGLEITRRLSSRLEGRLLLSSNSTDGTFDDSADGPADSLGFFAFRDVSNVERRGADVRFDYYVDANRVVTWGFEAEGQTQQSINESDSEFGVSTGSLDASRRNAAVYGQTVWGLGRIVAATAGVRLDENEEFGTFLTFRGGARVTVLPSLKLRGSAGSGFKEPTFLENFSSGFTRGNPNLDPEKSLGWEAGAELTFARGLGKISADYFYQDYEDLIQFTAAPAAPTDPNFFNVAEARSRGVELALDLAASIWNLRGSLTLMDTKVTDAGFDAGDPEATFAEGERLLRRPETVLSAWGGVRLPRGSTAGLSVTYVGARVDRDFSTFPAPRVTLDSYATLGASARIGVLPGTGGRPRLTATVTADNLLDEDYETNFGFPARGRTIHVGMELGS